jgi:hypothetical protein
MLKSGKVGRLRKKKLLPHQKKFIFMQYVMLEKDLLQQQNRFIIIMQHTI